MKTKTSKEVGLFEGLNDLHAFIDDQLIYLRNIDRSRNVNLFCGDKKTKDATKEFLMANGFNTKESKDYLLVEFSDSKKESDILHIFFVNTRYGENEISEIIQRLLKARSEASSNLFIHYLNSDSYIGYYEQHKEKENTRLIGSLGSPTKMENWGAEPF